jgi:predicted DNA-binding transcriptional regulator AlpA
MTEKRITAAAVRGLCGGISDMTLWRWLDRLSFPKPTYIGRRRYWRESEILVWLEAQAQRSDEAA